MLTASLRNGNSSGGVRTHALQRPTGRRRKKVAVETNGATKPGTEQPRDGAVSEPLALLVDSPVQSNHHDLVQLNLRQKLAEVRRRIGYIRARLQRAQQLLIRNRCRSAGAVGDILAELGVVIIPSWNRSPTSQGEETARKWPLRTGGDGLHFHRRRYRRSHHYQVAAGLDAGDKAPYKAMTEP